MEKKIVQLLKTYSLDDCEIADMLEIAPMLEYVSYEDFMKNCLLLVQYGFPKSDLDVLFMLNPNIFAMSQRDLENKLKKLEKSGENIEETLKRSEII